MPLEVLQQGPKDTEVEVTCPMCKGTRRLVVPTEGWRAWTDGRLIQDAFPGITIQEREALITGYCEPCWARIFPEDEEGIA